MHLQGNDSLDCERLSHKFQIEILPLLALMGNFPLSSAETRFFSHIWVGYLSEWRMFSCELSAVTPTLSAVGTQPGFKLIGKSETLESVKAYLTRHGSYEVPSLLKKNNTGPLHHTTRFLF